MKAYHRYGNKIGWENTWENKWHPWKNKDALYYAIINQMHDAYNQTDEHKNGMSNLKAMIGFLLSREVREGKVLPPDSLILDDIVTPKFIIANKKIMLNKTDLIEALNDVCLDCNSGESTEQRKMGKAEKESLASDINFLFDGKDNIDLVDFIISSENIDLLKAFSIEASYSSENLSINLENLEKLIERCCDSGKRELGRKFFYDLIEDINSKKIFTYITKEGNTYTATVDFHGNYTTDNVFISLKAKLEKENIEARKKAREEEISLNRKKSLESYSVLFENNKINSLFFSEIDNKKGWEHKKWQSKNMVYYAIINQMHYADEQTDNHSNANLNLRSMISFLFSKEVRNGEVSPPELLISNDKEDKKIILNKSELIGALNDVYQACTSGEAAKQRKMGEAEKERLASNIESIFYKEDHIDILDFIIISESIDLLKAFTVERSYEETSESINLDNLEKLIQRCCKLDKRELGIRVLDELKEKDNPYDSFINKGQACSLLDSKDGLKGFFDKSYEILGKGNSGDQEKIIAQDKDAVTPALAMSTDSLPTNSTDSNMSIKEPDSGKQDPSVS